MNITIIGGGFGGVKTALELAKNKKHRITLISDKADFQYYPTLYSSATGHSHRESWTPLGEIFGDHDNVNVFIDEIIDISVDKSIVVGKSGKEYSYERLVMALGVVTTYFGIEGLETYSYGIKSEEEIRRLKHRLFVDIAEKRELDKNYVVIGAGPTGVELAAAIGSYIKRLAKHYRLRKNTVSVKLIEAAPRVLPRSSEHTSRKVATRLKKLGVKVQTNKKVERESANELIVSGKPVESHTVIWTSGVANHPFFARHPSIFKLAPNGRVIVDDYMKAHDGIYVIGDNAATKYAGLAQTALHDAVFLAGNFNRASKRKKLRKYRAVMPISAIPVGDNWAVVEWKWIKIYGFIGAMIRKAADLVGYSDLFPLGTSLGAWRAGMVYEHDYFTPTEKVKNRR